MEKIVKKERLNTPEGIFEVEFEEKSRKKVTTEEVFEEELAAIIKGYYQSEYAKMDSRYMMNPERMIAHHVVEWLKIRPKDYDEQFGALIKFIHEEVQGHKIVGE